MTDHIIDLSEDPAKLSVRNELLIVEREGCDSVSVPLREIAVLVATHPRISITQSVLAGMAAEGGSVIVCDGKFMPVGMLMPLDAHHVQAERIALQTEAKEPVKKRMWQQIIQAKISHQGALLEEVRKNDHGLGILATKVKSGDPDNVEGRAARKYWPALFDDTDFKRDREKKGANAFLNYGYAVLRAVISRAACAAGLHPSIGLHHHNRYDSFRLASDLMEPFRPLVDRAVVGLTDKRGMDADIDRDVKGELIEAVIGKYEIKGEMRTLFDVASRMCSSVVDIFAGRRRKIALPDFGK